MLFRSITLDDDLQNPPEEIPKFIEAVKTQGVEVVMGIPEAKRHEGYRNLAGSLMRYIFSVLIFSKSVVRMSSYRLISRKVIDELIKRQTMSPAIDPMIFSFIDTVKIKNIVIKHFPRKQGHTQYNLPKLFALFYDVLLNQLSLPLRVVNGIGFISSLCSLILLVSFLAKYFIWGIPIVGWTSLMTCLLFFFGLILFTLGLMGEYLIRILREVDSSKNYVVDEINEAYFTGSQVHGKKDLQMKE